MLRPQRTSCHQCGTLGMSIIQHCDSEDFCLSLGYAAPSVWVFGSKDGKKNNKQLVDLTKYFCRWFLQGDFLYLEWVGSLFRHRGIQWSWRRLVCYSEDNEQCSAYNSAPCALVPDCPSSSKDDNIGQSLSPSKWSPTNSNWTRVSTYLHRLSARWCGNSISLFNLVWL